MNKRGPLPRVGIVIPAHNRKAKTLRCLESLFATRRDGFSLEVIVVDDGSTDGTSEAIEQLFPSVHLIYGSGQLYWTAAVNQGIKKALALGCDWVLVSNDDTVYDSEFLVHLVHCAQQHPGAIVGAKILYLSKPDTVRFAGATWALKRLGWYYPDEGRPVNSLGAAPFKVGCINGNCCLIPRDVFIQYGLYDENNFPHCYADSVFTILAHRKRVTLLIEPKACVWDDESDVIERLQGAPVQGVDLLTHVFFSQLSAYYLRAFFLFYWLSSPSKIEGMILFTYRLVRISTKVFLALLGIRPFYQAKVPLSQDRREQTSELSTIEQ